MKRNAMKLGMLAAVMAVFAAGTVYAEGTIKEDAHEAKENIKSGSKEAWHATKRGAHEAKTEIKSGAKQAWHATKEGAHEAKEKVKSAFKGDSNE